MGEEGVQIGSGGELPVEDGALDLCGRAQLHMEELFKALHDGGEGSLFSGECADGFVYVKCGKELFDLDRIGIPIQRRFDVRFGCDEEIRVVRTHLVVLGVEYNFVPSNPDCIRNQSFFSPRRTTSKAKTRLS